MAGLAINAKRDGVVLRHSVSRKGCSHIVVKNSFTSSHSNSAVRNDIETSASPLRLGSERKQVFVKLRPTRVVAEQRRLARIVPAYPSPHQPARRFLRGIAIGM
jgi:hypothetical protein